MTLSPAIRSPRDQLLGLLEERDGPNCFYCDFPVGRVCHIDHVVPRAHGGTDDPGNLVIACAPCNLNKGTTRAWLFAVYVAGGFDPLNPPRPVRVSEPATEEEFRESFVWLAKRMAERRAAA